MLKLNLKRWVVLLAVAFCCWSFTNGLNITVDRKDDLLISYDNSYQQNQDGNNNATTSSYDRKALLESMLGPQKKPFSFVFFMGTTYMLIFICGIIGNISTCFVVIFNNCMHTTTNYYLFSLAVSDVLSLLMGLPPELYSIVIQAYPWVFGETFCVIRTFIFETTTIASVLTILTFTFERWLHICKAIYAKKFSSGFSRALKIILFIWLVSGLLATPYAFTTGVYYQFPEYVESRTCNILDKHKDLMKRVIQISVLFLFIMPMTLISIMYVLIGITLWKSQTRHKCFNSTNNSAKSNQSAAGLAAAQVTRERGGFSRLSRFFHRPSSTAMNAFNHTNAGGNMINGGIGGVQTTSLMRKHGGGGSAGAGLTTFRGGIGSMKSKTPKFKFIYPSQQSQSSQSHESSTSGNGVLPGATLSVKKPSLASNKSSSAAAAAAAAGTKSAKISKKNVSDYLLVSHAGGGANNATANNATNRNNERKLSDFSVGDFSICYGNTTNGVGSFHYGHGTHRTSDRASKEFEHISYRARQSRRDVVKMLFVVVLAFFTCWAPYHSQRFITTYYEPTSTLMMKVFEYIFYISGISIYISSTINPILYNVMSKRYRTAFRNTLKMICSCHFSTKSNHHAFVRGSKYYSSINFKAMNVNNNNNNNLPANSRRQAQV